MQLRPARARVHQPIAPPSGGPIPPKLAAQLRADYFCRKPAAAAKLSMVAALTSRTTSVALSRKTFDGLAQAGTAETGIPEVKFLIDRQTHKVFFLTPPHKYHYNFAHDELGVKLSIDDFNAVAYNDPNRRYIAGTLTAYDHLEKGATYAMSYWSTDKVDSALIAETMGYLKTAVPFASKQLAYRPGGDTQEKLLDRPGEARKLADAGVRVLTNDELSQSFTFSALNPGTTFGELRVIKGDGSGQPPAKRGEIVIYADQVPTDPLPSAGMLTPLPQTQLSHAALKARQDKTPYAYARDLMQEPSVRDNIGKIVKLEVSGSGYKIVPATKAEAEKYLNSLRPKQPQSMKVDLSEKNILELGSFGFDKKGAFGTKATNVAEMDKLAADGLLAADVPEGYGIPASIYVDFMKQLEQKRDAMIADPKFQADVSVREKMLEAFRKEVQDAPMPKALQQKLDALEADFKKRFPGRDMRIRSSSNSEDLEGFSGAGLFDSYTFRYGRKDQPGRSLADRVKQTFASAWNLRAVEEFIFYRIEPKSVAMSCLVTPNEDDEIANGVVRWGGGEEGFDSITVNAQVGESLVTNPDANAVPDSLIVGNFGFNSELELQYKSRTNQKLPAGRKTVLTPKELSDLHAAMKQIQEHFRALYGGDDTFSIECEFKIDKNGKLLIKQARPWVG